MVMLTFIIPVRHLSVEDDSRLDLMMQTFRSIAAQQSPDWKAIVVANRGAELPDLPPKFDVVAVDFPYRPLPSPEVDLEAMYNAIRDDKGARVRAGVAAAGPDGHIMVADYDDLVSRRLAGFVAQHHVDPGWYIRRGYKYDGSTWLQTCPHFDMHCGTSLIVRADLLQPPTDADELPGFIRFSIGSHKFLRGQLAENGTPLRPLPFEGALYRVGHAQSSVGTRSFRRQLTLRSTITSPRRTFRVFRRLRRLTPRLKDEFFG
jgi:hypothetical protein